MIEIPENIKDLPEGLHFVVVTARCATRIHLDYLELKGIEHVLVSQKNFPDGAPGGCEYMGLTHINGVKEIISSCTKEELYGWLDTNFPEGIRSVIQAVAEKGKEAEEKFYIEEAALTGKNRRRNKS